MEAEALAKAKQEEYDKWKDMFSVDEAGEEAGGDAEEDGLLERFISYMKEQKVTVLEEQRKEVDVARDKLKMETSTRAVARTPEEQTH